MNETIRQKVKLLTNTNSGEVELRFSHREIAEKVGDIKLRCNNVEEVLFEVPKGSTVFGIPVRFINEGE